MIANYHTHTFRCHHAVGSEREYIENAIKGGMKFLGFSDHAPQFYGNGYVSGVRMTPEEAPEYVETIKALAKEYKNDIEIAVGFEAEYFPDIFDRLISFSKKLEIDYLIMGQHWIDNESSFPNVTSVLYECDSEKKHKEELTLYVNRVLEGLKTGYFTYLAHPDVFVYRGHDDSWYNKEMTRLCENAKTLSIPLEVNLLGLQDGRWYPTERFFKIAQKVGNDIVIGCDAHSPEVLSDINAQLQIRKFAENLNLNIVDTVKLRNL